MAAQPEDHQMEGVENPAQVADKGKGKAAEAMEESADDDSSDESGNEAEVRFQATSYYTRKVANLVVAGCRGYDYLSRSRAFAPR
jgi:hypothetical protein